MPGDSKIFAGRDRSRDRELAITLECARNLIITGWCRGWYARDKNGRKVSRKGYRVNVHLKKIEKYDLQGAVKAAAKNEDVEAEAIGVLTDLCPVTSLSTFNDSESLPGHVLKLLSDAIDEVSRPA